MSTRADGSSSAPVNEIVAQAEQSAQEGDLERVESILVQGIRHHPSSTELLCHLGYFYYQQKRWRKAEGCLRNAVDQGADDNARVLLAQAAERRSQTLQQQSDSAPSAYHSWMFGFARRLMGRMVSGYDLDLFHRFIEAAPPKVIQSCIAYHKTCEIQFALASLSWARPGARLLDLGTGYNALPAFWSRYGADAFALDGSPYGMNALKCLNTNCAFACGDVTDMPFGDALFDGVSALCMIEHIPYDGDIRAMQEIYRVLKPGGVAAVTVEACSGHFEEWLEVPYEIGYQRADDQSEEMFCRNYSPETFTQRIVNSAPWEAQAVRFVDDGFIPWRRWFNAPERSAPIRLLNPMQPFISRLCFNDRDGASRLSPSSIALACLRKPL